MMARWGLLALFIGGIAPVAPAEHLEAPLAMDNLHTRQRDRFAARPEPILSPPRELAGPPALTRPQEQQP